MWFHVREVKLRDREWSGGGSRAEGRGCLLGTEFLVGKTTRLLQMEGGDGCTAM